MLYMLENCLIRFLQYIFKKISETLRSRHVVDLAVFSIGTLHNQAVLQTGLNLEYKKAKIDRTVLNIFFLPYIPVTAEFLNLVNPYIDHMIVEDLQHIKQGLYMK